MFKNFPQGQVPFKSGQGIVTSGQGFVKTGQGFCKVDTQIVMSAIDLIFLC